MKLGFIGLGLMGTPMVHRLMDGGFLVDVWNRNSSKAKALVEAGAGEATSIQSLAENSDIVMLCLTDAQAVEQVVFGEKGIANFGDSSQVLVDFSSIDPYETQKFSVRLAGICGMRWVDAPVSGGVGGAEKGELIIMAGGNPSDLAVLEPVFAPLAKNTTHMGEVGAGQATKMCNQMIVACNAVVVAETIALARKSGVDVTKLPGALTGGFADSIPFQILAPQMAVHDFTLRWKVGTLLKDLRGALSAADRNGSVIPLCQLAEDIMCEHNEQYQDKDLSTLIKVYE